MKILFAFFLIFLTVAFCSCNGQQKITPLSECVKLNNKGTEYLMNYPLGGENGLIMSIDFFNQALKCNPTYLTAYLNLATAYDYAKNYKKELTVYNKALILSNNHPSIMIQKAVLFEKMKMADSAKRIYQLTRRSVRDSLTNHPDDVNFIREFLLLVALTEGKESALKELNKRIISDPELKSKMASDYYFYQNFNKRAYIYHLTE